MTVHPSGLSQNDSSILARIDAQDETAIPALREYLESHGVAVFVNPTYPVSGLYRMVIGDRAFVESIFARTSSDTSRRLIMLWKGDITDARVLARQFLAKVVLLEPKILSSREVTQIFAFYFTGEEQVLNLRNALLATPKPPLILKPDIVTDMGVESPTKPTNITPPPLPKEQRVNPEEVDKNRIQRTIAAVYGSEKKTEQKHKKFAFKLPSLGPSALSVPFAIALVLFIFLLPYLWYGISLGMSLLFLRNASSAIMNGNGGGVRHDIDRSTFWTTQARNSLDLIGGALQLVGLEKPIRQQERVVTMIKSLNAGIFSATTLMENGQTLAKGLVPSSGEAPQEESAAAAIEQMKNDLFYVQNNLGLAQAELTNLLSTQTFPFSIPSVASTAQKGESTIRSIRGMSEFFYDALLVFPKIAGFKDKKTYLLLLQNSNELRPAGGFIGSIATVSFNDGRIGDLAVQDVYTLDGQLRGHIDPPEPIRSIIGQEHWYLRDSNWDPDFSVSGARAAWFYEKETGTIVDGVIGISLPFVQDLLTITGPVDLPDYNDRITADNFFSKSLFYVQNDFFPGSTQKKDFLGSLTSALLTKLTATKSLDPVKLARVFSGALSKRNIQFYFVDPETETLVDQFGWSGTLRFPAGCADTTGTCVSDMLSLIEANLGVNKANYFVKRSDVHKVAFGEDGMVREEVSLAYTNSATGAGDGGGPYRDYLRVFLPKDTIVTNATLDGMKIPLRSPKESTKPTLPFIEPTTAPTGLYALGIAFEVPPQGGKTLTISYQIPTPFTFTSSALYTLTTRGQSGMEASSSQTIISYPMAWSTSQQNKKSGVGEGETVQILPAFAKNGQLEYNNDLSRDTIMRITFTK